MSYTTLFKVPESGEIEDYADINNSLRGAFSVWSEMAKVYLGMEYLPMSGNRDERMQLVWDLSKSERVPLNDRIVMASTFDRVMFKREHLLTTATAMDDFGNRHDPGHLPEQARKLRELAQDESCFAVCWRQTSVTSDMWMEHTGELDENGDMGYRMYDVSKDDNHWFLFDEIPLPQSV